MKKHLRIHLSLIALLIIGVQIATPALAATIIPCGTTEPQLEISKFSFNSTTDFVDISVINDGNNGSGATLNGWKLGTIDSTLKTLTNFSIRTGETYSFKDIPGLTATTDQIVIIDDKGIIKDAVCWTSSTPTDQEKSDFLKLGTEWNGSQGDCLSSNELPKETIFARSPGVDTSTGNDWKIQTTPLIPVENPTPLTVSSSFPVATNEVIINELFADPEGSDDSKEWIELKNTSDHPVSLAGWQLDDIDGGSKPYAFKDETIGPESFLLMSNTVTNITLNNTTDAARLIDPNGTATSQYVYPKIETGKSWARMKNGEWEIAINTTPGEENEETATTDADSTTEPDANIIDQGTANQSPVDVSEVFPNPQGSDTGNEWIEIRNSSGAVLDVSGWKIKNAAGKTFTFPEGTTIEALGYITVSDKTTKIQLKNTGDQVQLIDADNTVQDTIEFQSAPENVSFANIATVGIDDGNTENAQKQNAVSWKDWFIPSAHAQDLKTSQESQESQWEWTDMITKGKPNPVYYRIKGTILRELDEKNSFDIEKNGKAFTIQIDPKKIQPDLIKSITKLGETIEITAIQKDGLLVLESYKTINESSESESSPILIPLLISGSIITVIIAGWIIKIKFRRDQDPLKQNHTLSHKFQEEQLT